MLRQSSDFIQERKSRNSNEAHVALLYCDNGYASMTGRLLCFNYTTTANSSSVSYYAIYSPELSGAYTLLDLP